VKFGIATYVTDQGIGPVPLARAVALISAHPVRPARPVPSGSGHEHQTRSQEPRAFAQDAILDLRLHTRVVGQPGNEKR